MAATPSTGAQQNTVGLQPRRLRRQKARIGQKTTKTVANSPETSSSSRSTSRSYNSGCTLVSRFSDTSSEGSLTSLDIHSEPPNQSDTTSKESLQDWFIVPRTNYWIPNGGPKPNPLFEEDGYDSDTSAHYHGVDYSPDIETATYNSRPVKEILANSGVDTWTDYPLSTSPRTSAWPGGPPGLTENPTMWEGAAVYPRRRGVPKDVDWGGRETGGKWSRRSVGEWEGMAVGAKERNYDANGERLGEDGLPLDLEKVRKAAQERYEWKIRGCGSPRSKR